MGIFSKVKKATKSLLNPKKTITNLINHPLQPIPGLVVDKNLAKLENLVSPGKLLGSKSASSGADGAQDAGPLGAAPDGVGGVGPAGYETASPLLQPTTHSSNNLPAPDLGYDPFAEFNRNVRG